MISVSLCMIVKNEENTIERCLDSVKDLVDEIIIVDTGSTDRTKEIVANFTDKVLDFEWVDDFAAARNFAFDQATQDYILWLDADDVFLIEDQTKFSELKSQLDSSYDSITMVYSLATDENSGVTSSLRRNRLVKRDKHFKWIGAVHEYLEVWGNIFHSDIKVTHKSIDHDSDRNLNIYKKRLSNGESFSPRDLYYFANEWLDHEDYEKAIIYYKKFLETKEGWVEDNLSACGHLADCFHRLGNKEQALHYIFKSFEYDTPRAEFCCRLGYLFLNKQDYEKAIFWYELATKLEMPRDSLGLVNHACWTWLPHLQLCVCYSKIGDFSLAHHHNELAREVVPTNNHVLHNKAYLEKVLNKNQ